MRKLFNLFAAALVMLAAVSCEKNEVLPDNNSEGKVVTLNASINNGGTKTSLGPGVQEGSNTIQYPVYWSENDAIAVIQQEDMQDGSVYIFTLSEGGAGKASATFTCDNANGFNPDLEYRAVYPANSVVLSDGKFNGYSFSATQPYVQNSFGVGAMPMQTNTYIGTNRPLNFSNVFGVLKLQLKGAADEKVTSIVITSDNALNGEANLEFGKIVLSGASDENKKVTLDCGAEGVALKTNDATDFLISIPPGEHNFTITVNSTIGDIPKAYNLTTTQTIEAGVIKKMAVMDFNIAYIDETGAYRGDGIALPAGENKTIIWAPVNCGYDANHKYGLLYQWGRKYGQGYTTTTYGETEPNVATAPAVSKEDGKNPNYANEFYPCSHRPFDWVPSQDNTLWNSGSADVPIKTDYDPCPDGWRVPTNAELLSLLNGLNDSSTKSSLISQWETNSTDPNHSGLKGFLFYGNTTETTGNKVFFPAAGHRSSTGSASERDRYGYYWSSSVAVNNGIGARNLSFYPNNSNDYSVNSGTNQRANGFSVRCVKN